LFPRNKRKSNEEKFKPNEQQNPNSKQQTANCIQQATTSTTGKRRAKAEKELELLENDWDW
jgi:hypothetical protein